MSFLIKDVHASINPERVMHAMEGDSLGLCVACGEDAFGVES
jgi:hypothetical protein